MGRGREKDRSGRQAARLQREARLGTALQIPGTPHSVKPFPSPQRDCRVQEDVESGEGHELRLRVDRAFSCCGSCRMFLARKFK